jgi:hypothetical protein
MKSPDKIGINLEPISRLRCIWIETGDAVPPLACKWTTRELTTSTDIRVKHSNAKRRKGDRHGKISHFAFDDAVQCTSTKTITPDLSFIHVKRGDWVVCSEGGKCYVAEDAL